MKVLKSLVKTILAGIVALVILSTLMFGYYFMPLRENNPNKNTDYVWAANTPWASLTEGISYGVTDSNGYINPMVIDNPDILFLGSSHLQAMSVMPNENMCSLLNDKFDGKYQAYNMGISGHTIYKVVQYLNQTLSVYQKVPEYVIIETSDVNISQSAVDQALSGDVKKTEVIDKGIIAEMQKIPYLRQLYHQLDGGMLDMLIDKKKGSSSGSPGSSSSNKQTAIDETPFETLLSYLQKTENEYNTKIIVMYHPFETLHNDGSISFSDADYSKVFAQYAQKHDVGFVDMTEDFEVIYYNEHHVPHGFSTGELGVGHINKYGHAAIANRLYQYINELEEK